VTSASWRTIQGLRAAPTGNAGDDERRRIFTAALNQAEELAVAASEVGYAARPLLQFYSLSQAGRAIAAAHLRDKAELTGHGLSFSHNPEAVLMSTVAPPKRQKHNGAFQDVAVATGSPGLQNPAELGALWAANPDLQQVPVPDGGHWPRALSYVIGTRGQSPTLPTTTGGIVYTRLELPGRTGADLDRVIAQYPTLLGARALKHDPTGDTPAGPEETVGRVATTDGRMAVTVAREAPMQTTLDGFWELEDGLYSAVEVDDSYPLWPHPHLVGYVQPSIGGGLAPSTLMLWWALLLALSSLARYHPAAWVQAIDLDQSVLAAPLREVLDVAAVRIPTRVLDALRDHQAAE
jgi:hypothetical protein